MPFRVNRWYATVIVMRLARGTGSESTPPSVTRVFGSHFPRGARPDVTTRSIEHNDRLRRYNQLESDSAKTFTGLEIDGNDTLFRPVIGGNGPRIKMKQIFAGGQIAQQKLTIDFREGIEPLRCDNARIRHRPFHRIIDVAVVHIRHFAGDPAGFNQSEVLDVVQVRSQIDGLLRCYGYR